MTAQLMECGHTANGVLVARDGVKFDPPLPCCASCGSTEPVAAPKLDGRQSKCASCNKLAPSSLSLAFFEYRGPGSVVALNTCECGFFKVAHIAERRATNPHICASFKPRGAYEFDSHYDGCRGWD